MSLRLFSRGKAYAEKFAVQVLFFAKRIGHPQRRGKPEFKLRRSRRWMERLIGCLIVACFHSLDPACHDELL